MIRFQGVAEPRLVRFVSCFASLIRGPCRGVALPLLGMTLGLMLSGLALFSRGTPQLSVPPAGYPAMVNGEGILMSDFIAETQTETQLPFEASTAAQRNRVLRQMINQELLVQRGLVLGLPETATEVRSAMADAVNAQAAAPALAEPTTEAALYAYYLARRSHYRAIGSMTVRDLVMHVGGYLNTDQTFSQAEADAIEAVYQLRSGAPIGGVMDRYGLVDSGRGGEGPQPDFAARLRLGERLYEVASGLSSGQVSDPVPMPDGVHILVTESRQSPAPESFPEARAQVYSDYRQALVSRAQAENLRLLRSQAQILIAPGLSP